MVIEPDHSIFSTYILGTIAGDESGADRFSVHHDKEAIRKNDINERKNNAPDERCDGESSSGNDAADAREHVRGRQDPSDILHPLGQCRERIKNTPTNGERRAGIGHINHSAGGPNLNTMLMPMMPRAMPKRKRMVRNKASEEP